MSPLSAIAVTRLAGNAAVAASRATTQAVEQFADVFAGIASAAEPAANGRTADSADAEAGEPARTVASSIIERIRQLLGAASLPANQSLELELSPLGGLFVSGESDQRGSIEATLAHDPQLRELLGRWSSLSGDRIFSYSGDSP